MLPQDNTAGADGDSRAAGSAPARRGGRNDEPAAYLKHPAREVRRSDSGCERDSRLIGGFGLDRRENPGFRSVTAAEPLHVAAFMYFAPEN